MPSVGMGTRYGPDAPLVPSTVDDGKNGWTPIMVGEADGERRLLRIKDWVGGTGTKPATGYIGGATATGLVSKANAFNFA